MVFEELVAESCAFVVGVLDDASGVLDDIDGVLDGVCRAFAGLDARLGDVEGRDEEPGEDGPRDGAQYARRHGVRPWQAAARVAH